MIKLKTIKQIKKAVDQGENVLCDGGRYQVYKEQFAEYRIRCLSNNYITGLHGLKGTIHENNLNGSNFYYN